MGAETKHFKTNEQVLLELQKGIYSSTNILNTPYSHLRILLDTCEFDNSYRDDDGDWVRSTKTVIERKALLRYENGNYSFLFENWFDDIDNFEIGLYAKVRLGRFYNLVNPLGEYIFPNWHEDIEFYGNNLICCYADISVEDERDERLCSIFDRRGNLLLQNVIVKSEFIHGQSVISKDGLFNYLDANGNLLKDDWLLDALPYEKMGDKLFAFVKNINGWGVINQQGDFAFPPRFNKIRKAEWSWHSYGGKAVAVVEDERGQNILMNEDNRNEESLRLLLGFRESVNSLFLIGHASRVLASVQGEYGIYEWNQEKLQFECSLNIGELDSIGDTLFHIKNDDYWLVMKGGLYNVVGARGLIFSEWYSEILIYGNLFKVTRRLDALNTPTGEIGKEETPVYEFNLLSPDGSYNLKEWTRSLIITPFEDAFLVNIKPKMVESIWDGIYDASLTYEDVQFDHYRSSRIKKIEGICNIILGDLLFNTWYDGIEFLNGKIFAKGYLKVWNEGKCNLVDEHGEYVSPEWVDDFVASRWQKDSYFSDIKSNAFLVKNANKMNLLYNGKFILNQWFASIGHYNGLRFSNTRSMKEAYCVHDACMEGIYYLGKGLVGGRLFETIHQISDELYFCRFDKSGHIMSLEGRIITTAPIADVQSFENGYALVTTARIDSYDGFKYNYINSEGRLVSPVWFDGDRYMQLFGYSDDEQPLYIKVCKDSKYNLINSDKQLVFKNWYDSIEGDEGKWLISDESRGDSKYNFLDNNENLLSYEWFKGVYKLANLDKGSYVVETEYGYNVFNKDNELSLSEWSKKRIYDDYSSGLAFIGDHQHNLYLNHSGHLITPYHSYDNSVKKCYCNIGGNYEYILIIDLYENDFHGGWMQILCRRDGTPFFKDIIHRPYSIHSSNNDYLTSVFGHIEEYSLPGIGSVLLINKHWPIKNGDVKRCVIIDYEGKELSEEFEEIGKFDDNGYAVVERNGYFNVINKDFQIISSLWFNNLGYEYRSIETEYSEYLNDETGMVESSPYQVERERRDASFHNGYLKVELAGSFNLMDEAGRIQFPVWYDSLAILPFGYYKVKLNGLFNIVDASNQCVSDIWFDKMAICKSDYNKIIYLGQKGALYRLLFLRESSAVLSDDWFDTVFRYDKSEGYYSVQLNEKKNFVTDNGKLFVPGWHDDQLLFRDKSGDYVVVKDGDKFNIYSSRQSRFLADIGFDNVIKSESGLFNSGWCGVQVDGKYTFVNEDGILSEGRFDSINEYRYGFAGVVLGGKKNYLTSEGTLLSELWFDQISAFSSFKKAVVKINGKFNIIDSTGALLLPDELIDISAIELIESEYCLLSFNSEDGKTSQKYYDFKTARLHDSERSVKEYLEGLKADIAKANDDNSVAGAESDKIDANPIAAERNNQIRQLIENNGKTGINYTLVRFGNKSNLVDKTGSLLFEEWVDSSSIQMCQGLPLMKQADDKWIIVK